MVLAGGIVLVSRTPPHCGHPLGKFERIHPHTVGPKYIFNSNQFGERARHNTRGWFMKFHQEKPKTRISAIFRLRDPHRGGDWWGALTGK